MDQVFSSGYRGREVVRGTRVLVYKNLHNGKFSVMADEGQLKGKVVGHFDCVAVEANGENMIKLSSAGQARARREQRRNVHAFVRGRIVAYSGWI